MATLAKHLLLSHTQKPSSTKHSCPDHRQLIPNSPEKPKLLGKRSLISTLLAASVAVAAAPTAVLAQTWGTKSFFKEKYLEPGLSPEESAARIRQTAEGLRAMREMLDNMSWTYVRFYIRLKSAYLSYDLNSAILTLPENRRSSYVKTANELVDNMAEFDYYVRTPKIYESYVYYEKTLKSLDDLVAMLA